MINKRFILLGILMIVLFLCKTEAEQKLTPFSVEAGLFGSIDLYKSSFSNLPGVPNCCTEFTSALGPGYGLFGGIKYKTKYELLQPVSVDALIKFSSLQGKFSKDAFFDNIIIGNQNYKGISRYDINTTLNILSVEPGISLYPLKSIPLNLRLGFDFGFVAGSDYSQQEELLEPTGVTFETGTRLRDVSTGKIPQTAALLFGLDISFKYDVYKYKNLVISPSLNYEHYFNNVISGLDWKINTIKAGVELSLGIAKTELLPPMPPPFPPYPEPQKSAGLILALDVKLNNSKLSNLDTVSFYYNQTEFVKTEPIAPILFYSHNSSIPDRTGTTMQNGNIKPGINVIKAVANYMISNQSIKCTVELSSTNDENPIINDQRAEALLAEMKNDGVDASKVYFTKTSYTSKLKHPELADEKRFAKFVFSDGCNFVYNVKDSISSIDSQNLNFGITTEAVSSSPIVARDGEIIHRGGKIFSFKDSSVIYSIKDNNIFSKSGPNGNELVIKCKIVNEEGDSREKQLEIVLKPVINENKVYENIITTEGDSVYYSEFLTGLFNYDESEFSMVNSDAVNKIKKLAPLAESIEIIPMTDNFGTEAHNKILSAKRAAKAAELIDLPRDKYKVVYPNEYFYTNDTPMGRMLNRSVVVKLKQKK